MLIKHSQQTKIFVAIIFSVVLLFGGNNFAQNCKSKVEIVTNNAGSLIYVDSILIGKGRAKVELEKGKHLLFVKESMLKWNPAILSDSIRINNCDKDYLFNYELKTTGLSSVNQMSFEKETPYMNESFFNSSTFKILLGSAAVLGGVAAYFKNKADNKYDDYLQTKDQSLLDTVDRLDLYSGIFFGLLQINFGYLIYKFLTD